MGRGFSQCGCARGSDLGALFAAARAWNPHPGCPRPSLQGRGTSTEDGVALAQATLEHLATSTRCLTLFVTHYPEVPAAAVREGLRDAVRLGRMAVLERGGTPPSVAFLHRLEPGAATASFGLNVARMAALPPAVLSAAGARAAHAGGLGTALKDVLAASERAGEDLGALQQHVHAVLALCPSRC